MASFKRSSGKTATTDHRSVTGGGSMSHAEIERRLQTVGQGTAGTPVVVGSSDTLAPNAKSATADPTYFLDGNDPVFGFSGVITLPTDDPNFSTLQAGAFQVMAFAPDDTKGGQIAWIPGDLFGEDTVAYTGGQFTQPTSIVDGWVVKVYAVNSSGTWSKDPVVVSAITIQPSAVRTAVGSFSTINNTVDKDTRQVHAHPAVTVKMVEDTAQSLASVWVSQDNADTFGFYGVFPVAPGGSTIPVDTIAPTEAEIWEFACQAGWTSYSSSVPLPKAQMLDLIAGKGPVVYSGPVALSALELPLSHLIQTRSPSDPGYLTVMAPAAGESQSFPYNYSAGKGLVPYWCIPWITYDDTPCVDDSASFFVRITVQSLDANKQPISPERPYDGTQVTGDTQTCQPLMGPYGPDISGMSPNNVAYLRIRVYVCNRADQTSASFLNAAAGTLQTWVGVDGHLDILVAQDGAIPTTTDKTLYQKANVTGINNNLDGSMFLCGDFEKDTSPWQNLVGTSTTAPHSGQACGTAGAWGFSQAAMYQWVKVVPGQRYLCSSWLKCDAGNSSPMAGFYIDYFLADQSTYVSGGGWTNASTPMSALSTAWQQFKGITAPVPASAVYARVFPVLATGIATGNVYVDDVTFGPALPLGSGQNYDSAGNIMVNVSGPLYTDISNNLTIRIANDFTITGTPGNYSLSQATVDLGKAVGFDTSIFGGGKNNGGSGLTINALGVNKLVAGDSLFTGQATFAFNGGGKLTLNSLGLTIADSNISPVNTLTLSASGASIAHGSGAHVDVTANGIGLYNSVGTANPNVQVTANGIYLYGPTGLCLSITSSGLTLPAGTTIRYSDVTGTPSFGSLAFQNSINASGGQITGLGTLAFQTQISGTQIATGTLIVSQISGWAGSTINFTSGATFSCNNGSLFINQQDDGYNSVVLKISGGAQIDSLKISSNIYYKRPGYSNVYLAAPSETVTISNIALHFVNGLYTGYTIVG